MGAPSAAVGAAFLAGTCAGTLTGVGAAEGLLAEVALATGVTSFLPTVGGLAAEGTAAAGAPVQHDAEVNKCRDQRQLSVIPVTRNHHGCAQVKGVLQRHQS